MKEITSPNGFTVLRKQPVGELDAVMYHMRHEKTGLELIWLARDEENKTFGIAFQTLPEDDTGVFHILEHSVLCGSDKYPLKEPFVELMKNSMNTFLNAMTFPDKTVYPISSRNDKDFLNLTRVYLDAVFHPLIYSKPEIFRQEGWHYEFDENGAPSYKGVVFNEMRGAFSDVDELAENAIMRALFPESTYRFVSGGDPEHIPDLTYEQFLDSHRRCYSPSNAYVFLDGDVDIDTVLGILDGEYLAGFEKSERLPAPAIQRPVTAEPRTVRFELAPEEDESNRYRLYWGKVVGDYSEREKLTAMQVLCTVLCGDNQAPLSRCILSQQLAEAVNMMVWDGSAQQWLKLEVRNVSRDNLQRVREAITGELERLSREGLDHGKLEAVMANLEFQMRERDYGSWPQGLMFGLNILDSWMRGGAPELNLEVGGLFDSLRSKMDEGYFEALIREAILDNPHSCEVVMEPSHTAGEERREAEADKLAAASAAWDEARRAELAALQESLTAWQESKDSADALAALPRLELSDISPEPEVFPTESGVISGVPLLRHEITSGGISYVTLYFDVTGLGEEEVSALSFLCRLLGKTATSKYSAEELSRRSQLLTGSMQFFVSSYENRQKPGEYSLKLAASVSILEPKAREAMELLGEILTSTLFASEREALDILRQAKTRSFQQLITSGHSISLGRVAAQVTAGAVADERAGGYAYYQWLKNAETNWDWEAFSSQFAELYGRVVSRPSLTVSITGSRSVTVDAAVSALVESLPARGKISSGGLRPWDVRREGIEIPSDVCYASMGGAFAGPFSGRWQLAARVVSLGWLWNAVRVQGGAYGTGMVARDSLFTGCYSYRDPDGAKSLENYLKSPGFLAEFAARGESLDGFIIGAVSDSEPLLTPRSKGLSADTFYFRGLTHELRRAQRHELLEASSAGLDEIAGLLRAALENGGVCVLAPRAKLEACKLDEIMTL